MKIFIGGDSRSALPKGTDWTTLLEHPREKIVAHRSCIECNTFSIFLLPKILEKYETGYFGLSIIQSGWNDGTYPWPSSFYNVLCNGISFQTPETPELPHLNIPRIQEMFSFLQTKSRRVLFIGLHHLVGNKFAYETNRIKMMEIYSSLPNVDVIRLPESEEWANEHTESDGIHYNEKGTRYIAGEVNKYLSKIAA